eukprot:13594297-Ditylum_brightwellii.AAC.2
MKTDAKSLEFANLLVRNRPSPILFYVLDSNKKPSPFDYQTYKLRTNPKDNKWAVYSLMVKCYKVIKGQNIQDDKSAYSLVKSLLEGDALQVFQNEEESQDVKDSLVFTKCLVAVTKHIFPKKA